MSATTHRRPSGAAKASVMLKHIILILKSSMKIVICKEVGGIRLVRSIVELAQGLGCRCASSIKSSGNNSGSPENSSTTTTGVAICKGAIGKLMRLEKLD